jgi:hypothetical protein
VQIVSSAAPDRFHGFLAAKHSEREFELSRVSGEEGFVCQVGTVCDPIIYNRYFVVDVHVGDGWHRLHSKVPNKAQSGRYSIYFGGKYTQKSIKNAILVDINEQNAIIVRRMSDEDIEVENVGGFSDFICFGFAIVSWICPY